MGSHNSHEREPRVASSSHQPDVERSFSQDPKHIQDLTRLIAAETNREHEVATDNYDYRKVCYGHKSLLYEKFIIMNKHK